MLTPQERKTERHWNDVKKPETVHPDQTDSGKPVLFGGGHEHRRTLRAVRYPLESFWRPSDLQRGFILTPMWSVCEWVLVKLSLRLMIVFELSR